MKIVNYITILLGVIQASFRYFALVFAFAFIFGTVRVLFVVDQLGGNELLAVLIELPFVLWVSWLAAKHVLYLYLESTENKFQRAAVGALAFVLLQGAEWKLSKQMYGLSGREYIREQLNSAKGVLGILGQLVFALIPLFVNTKIKEKQ